MVLILFILSGIVFAPGVRLATFSSTSLHAYQTFVSFLIASILFVGATVIESVNAQRRQIAARD